MKTFFIWLCGGIAYSVLGYFVRVSFDMIGIALQVAGLVSLVVAMCLPDVFKSNTVETFSKVVVGGIIALCAGSVLM